VDRAVNGHVSLHLLDPPATRVGGHLGHLPTTGDLPGEHPGRRGGLVEIVEHVLLATRERQDELAFYFLLRLTVA
jgi:hypothetical protein